MKYRHDGYLYLLLALSVMAARVWSASPACVGPGTLPGPTAAELLSRWAEALGGVEKIQTIKNVYIRSLTKMGELEYTTEEWQAAQGQHKQNIYSGHFRSKLMVFNGHEGWVRYQNAQVRDLAGRELAEEVSAAYLGSFSHLISGRMPGSTEYLGEDQDRRFYILKLEPEGGAPITCYLDKTTYLPARQEVTLAGVTLTTTFADWRAVEGVKFPFEQRYKPTEWGHEFVQVVRLNTDLDESAFRKLESRDAYFGSANRAMGIPFELRDNFICLEVRVNHSRPFTFILDTGWGQFVSTISQESARALGFSQKGSFAGDAIEGSVYSVTLDLPGVTLQNQLVAVASLNLDPYLGFRVDGILGYEFINSFVVEVSYADKLINLYDPTAYVPKISAKSIPITLLEGTLPAVYARITQADGTVVQGQFTVDTAAGATIVFSAPFVRAHRLLAANPKSVEGLSVGLEGKSRLRTGRVRDLQIGEFQILNPVADFSQATRGPMAGNRVGDGVIGGEVLRRFDLTLDYARKRLLLEPNENFADPIEINMSGLVIVPVGVVFKVLFVDSAAIATGIHRGDILEAIDGEPAKDFTLSQLNQMFKQNGRTFLLRVRRGRKLLQTKITMKRLL
jgi:Aspartyl protease